MAKQKLTKGKALRMDNCVAKAVYKSREIAFEAVEFFGMIGVQEPYKCRECQKYHLRTINRKLYEKRNFMKRERSRLKTANRKFKKHHNEYRAE